MDDFVLHHNYWATGRDGAAERSVRTGWVMGRKLIRSALRHSGFQGNEAHLMRNWPSAMTYAEFLLLIKEPSNPTLMSGFEMLFGRPWPIERPVPQWGSPCIVHRQYDERSPAGHGKLAMPGEIGYFAGFDFSGRGVHIINADTGNVYLAHSCIPLELPLLL